MKKLLLIPLFLVTLIIPLTLCAMKFSPEVEKIVSLSEFSGSCNRSSLFDLNEENANELFAFVKECSHKIFMPGTFKSSLRNTLEKFGNLLFKWGANAAFEQICGDKCYSKFFKDSSHFQAFIGKCAQKNLLASLDLINDKRDTTFIFTAYVIFDKLSRVGNEDCINFCWEVANSDWFKQLSSERKKLLLDILEDLENTQIENMGHDISQFLFKATLNNMILPKVCELYQKVHKIFSENSFKSSDIFEMNLTARNIIGSYGDLSFETTHCLVEQIVIPILKQTQRYSHVVNYFSAMSIEENKNICEKNSEKYLNYFLCLCWLESNNTNDIQSYLDFYKSYSYVFLPSAVKIKISNFARTIFDTTISYSYAQRYIQSIKPWQWEMREFIKDHPKSHFLLSAAAYSTATLAWCAPYCYKASSLNSSSLAKILLGGMATSGLIYYIKEKMMPKELLSEAWSAGKEKKALAIGTFLALGLTVGVKFLPQITATMRQNTV